MHYGVSAEEPKISKKNKEKSGFFFFFFINRKEQTRMILHFFQQFHVLKQTCCVCSSTSTNEPSSSTFDFLFNTTHHVCPINMFNATHTNNLKSQYSLLKSHNQFLISHLKLPSFFFSL